MRLLLFLGVLTLWAICVMSSSEMDDSDESDEDHISIYARLISNIKEENSIYSAISRYFIHSMAAFGARGETYQLLHRLTHAYTKESHMNSMNKIMDAIRDIRKNVTFEMANRIYIANNVKVKEEYKNKVSKHLHSEIGEIYVNDSKKTVDSINNWVAEKTDQKIKNIMKDGEIDSSTQMALFNAVYFKGIWATKFEVENTKEMDFHVSEKNAVKVPMMHRKGRMIYVSHEAYNFRVLGLPLKSKNLMILIMVPNEIEGYKKMEGSSPWFQTPYFSEREVDLYLPKFKIESTTDLEKDLREENLSDIFTGKANFSSISDDKLKVGRVIEKVIIEFDEEGGEPTDSPNEHITRGMPEELRYHSESDVKTFKVDRPFFYAVVTLNLLEVFAGFVYNPAA